MSLEEKANKLVEHWVGGKHCPILTIRDLPKALPSTIGRVSSTFSLGELEVMPDEIILKIIGHLDFQSLSRFSRVSLRAKEMVEDDCPAYYDMMEYAPEALTALGRTGLLKYHPAPLLRQTLYSSECAYCFEFGGYLLLLTCERVCMYCLWTKPSLWATTADLAQECFNLTEDQLQRIPSLYSIPGEYIWGSREVYRLVNVGDAKRLALEVHGSDEAIAELVAQISPDEPDLRMLFSIYASSVLQPPGSGPLLISHRPADKGVHDYFSGMTSMAFPTVGADGWWDYGSLCRGCASLRSDQLLHGDADQLPPDDQLTPLMLFVLGFALIDPQAYRKREYIQSLRLLSWEQFLKHIKNCRGVPKVLAGNDRVR